MAWSSRFGLQLVRRDRRGQPNSRHVRHFQTARPLHPRPQPTLCTGRYGISPADRHRPVMPGPARGTNGGATASCSATRTATATNGACGVANGVAIRTAPSSGLCAAGTPSSVMGAGPFAWSCAGLNGGTTAGCSAPLLASVVNGSCGSSNGGTLRYSAVRQSVCGRHGNSCCGARGPFTLVLPRGVNGGTTAACRANQQTRTVNSIGTLGRGGSRVYSFNVPTGATTASFVLTGTSGNARSLCQPRVREKPAPPLTGAAWVRRPMNKLPLQQPDGRHLLRRGSTAWPEPRA